MERKGERRRDSGRGEEIEMKGECQDEGRKEGKNRVQRLKGRAE